MTRGHADEPTAARILQAHATASVAGGDLLVESPSLGALLAEHAVADPHAVFLRFFDDDTGERATMSYADFDRAVDSAAQGLLAQGLAAGDCIATLSWNHPHAAVLLFAPPP